MNGELGRRAAAGDEGLADQRSTHSCGLSLRLHSGANSARNGGGNSHRSQKRGNKNVNQKEVRQRRGAFEAGPGSSRLSSTPRGTGLANNVLAHHASQFLAGSEMLDYGADHDASQMTPSVGQKAHGGRASVQQMKIPHDIKMKPLNLQ